MTRTYQPVSEHGTILHADVVGYCKRMACDARQTVEAVRASHRLLAQTVVDHGGRVIDMAGDSVLAVFPTEVSAMRAALSIQRRLRGTGGAAQPPLTYRIGVHAGELLSLSGAVYGNTVNIAARLQAAATPGHVHVSASTLERCGALTTRWAEPRTHTLKNIPGTVVALEDLL